jgi:cytochrome oxidase Cu insertion factor (SCO1/SenC/PrrC family)
MARFSAFVLLAAVPLTLALGGAQAGGKQKDNIKIEGTLTKDDPTDKRRGFACQVHTVKMKAGKTYTIDMISTDVDSYLYLDDSKGTQLAEDDDSGGMQNAQIVFKCPKDGDYKVVCTVYDSNRMTGKYVLTVKTSAETSPLATPHQSLIGKDAPDFKGDFAINGKAGKLSDLKGKVVLIAFWEARSLACADTFPNLRDWYKEYKGEGEGFEVVGVTYYNSEIGQRIAFDKETGKVITADTADKKSDQATFQALAAHHKLDYLLMALPKAEALRTFDAYAVNGLPQFVLVDRGGIVRQVLVGEKNVSALEKEIKKLVEVK